MVNRDFRRQAACSSFRITDRSHMQSEDGRRFIFCNFSHGSTYRPVRVFFIGLGTVRSEILRSQDLDASGPLKLQNLRSYEDHLDKFLEKIKIEVTDHMVESLNTEMKD